MTARISAVMITACMLLDRRRGLLKVLAAASVDTAAEGDVVPGEIPLMANGDGSALSCGKTSAASSQSRQPSRQTSESALTRPSEIHVRMISALAGPNCPPEAGRTYHTTSPASVSGSGVSDCGG